MKFPDRWLAGIAVGLTLAVLAAIGGQGALAQTFPRDLYAGMRWRLIGPFRGGRVTSVAGIPGNPAIYYIGTPGGGVWKTTDGARVWKPIFDKTHVAPVGALALAPSDPKIIYVGTGEQVPGNGVYKSTDGGANWTHVGLSATRYISSILIDPRNPDVVLVGAMGEQFYPIDEPWINQGRNPNRGVYKTSDGGKTWRKVLYRDELTGVTDMSFDPQNPKIVYAALDRPASKAFGIAPTPGSAPDSWIYKSTDEGETWKMLSGGGLPTGKMGRIALAAGKGNRVFAISRNGLYRSDDGGARWRKITGDPRLVGGRVFLDPDNPNVVYVTETSLYRSTDGGVHFMAIKGSPGGDDYHIGWIDPRNPNRMIMAVDQGPTVTLDGGKTWSSWFNIPNGQFYHVSTDNTFPYHVFGAQQDSGTAATLSRGEFGEITFRDWVPVGGFEEGYIVADPFDPNLVYSGGWYGSIVRFDRTTGQTATVFYPGTKYRMAKEAPMAFSPQNPHVLYLGSQYLLQTTDGGMRWKRMSPDLTARPGVTRATGNRLTITTLSPSPVRVGEIWAGTSDGLIELTRDGGAHWDNVSPPGLTTETFVSIVDASPEDPGTAYAAVDIFPRLAPHIYRTSDYGRD